MPIPKEFEKYRDEATFIRDFIVPLLRRLGFTIVDYHGKREYGRDLIFSEVDRFQTFVYHGLQAKYERSISQKESEGLIDDCRQAFRHPFQHPVTGENGYICSFVVANAGSFADNTPENFHEDARNNQHRGHVRLLDGKALLNLDRWATLTRVDEVGEVLSGLLSELKHNEKMGRRIVTYIKEWLDEPTARITLPVVAFRNAAFTHYIQKPILSTHIEPRVVDLYLTVVEASNAFLDALRQNPNRNSDIVDRFLECSLEMKKMIGSLGKAIKSLMDTLGPLASL